MNDAPKPTVAERLAAGETVPFADFTADDWHAINPHFADQWRDVQKIAAAYARAETLPPTQHTSQSIEPKNNR